MQGLRHVLGHSCRSPLNIKCGNRARPTSRSYYRCDQISSVANLFSHRLAKWVWGTRTCSQSFAISIEYCTYLIGLQFQTNIIWIRSPQHVRARSTVSKNGPFVVHSPPQLPVCLSDWKILVFHRVNMHMNNRLPIHRIAHCGALSARKTRVNINSHKPGQLTIESMGLLLLLHTSSEAAKSWPRIKNGDEHDDTIQEVISATFYSNIGLLYKQTRQAH